MSVHKEPGGGYRVRWRQDGRNRSRKFDRKRDADRYDAEIRRRRQLGTLATLDGGGRTLTDYVTTTWWPDHARTIALSTQRFYRALWATHIEPYLGDVALRDLTATRIREWQAARDEDGAGRNKLNRSLGMLGTILRRAVEDGEIATNPVERVRRLPAKRQAAIVPPTPSTVEKIRRHLNEQDAMVVATLAYAGLRPGEAFALRWSHVRDSTLLIEQATDGHGGTKATKTRSIRTVRLLPTLARDLKAWRLRSARSQDRDLVFPGPRGGVIDGHRYIDFSKRWRKACKAAKVDPAPRPYDLRHGFASLLLAEGRTIHHVAAQLGHDPALTLSTYGHVISEFEDRQTVDADAEIRKARRQVGSRSVPSADRKKRTA